LLAGIAALSASFVQQFHYRLFQAIRVNALTLVICQWMIRHLKLDPWSDSNFSLVDHCLEEHGVSISGKFRAQPAEMRPEAEPCRIIPMLHNLQVTLLTEGTPNTPGECASLAFDWNLKAGMNVEAAALVALNLALLATKERPSSFLV
jgi:hypothetical protein